MIAEARRRNADLNGDLAESAGSAPRRVGMLGPAHRFSPSTTSKSLTVRWRDLSAGTERSGPFRQIAVKDPRSVVQRVQKFKGSDSLKIAYSL